MIEVTIVIEVAENSSPGQLVKVVLTETIPMAHDDAVGGFLQMAQAVKRMVSDEALPKALTQVETYKMRLEHGS